MPKEKAPHNGKVMRSFQAPGDLPAFRAVAREEGESIGQRVAAKNAALRALDVKSEPVVDAAIDDLVGILEPALSGGSKRKRGGGQFSEAVGALFAGVKSSVASAGNTLDSAAATVVRNLPAILGVSGAVGGTVAVLNHPTVIGNLAEVTAKVFQLGTDASITSTWGDWGAALVQIKDALGTVASTVASQTAQGPVVPVAIAVAITLIRARKSGRSFGQVLKDDAAALTSVASRAVTGQMQAFSEGYRKGSMKLGPDQLKELAARIERPTGPGAAAMSSAASTGAPAAFGTPAGVGLTAASPGRVAQIPAAARGLAGSVPPPADGSTEAAAAALMDLSNQGGRGRKGKSRKTRGSRKTRRMTRRAKKITALKFVY